QNATLVRMWVECAVRVNGQGLPIDAPLRKMRPIAVQSQSTMYTVQQTVDKLNYKHGYFVQFQGKTFQLKGDGQRGSQHGLGVSKLIAQYRLDLSEAFRNSPLQAAEDSATQAPPGEFHFRRDFQASKVLEGFAGPYRELSYYNVRWWRADE